MAEPVPSIINCRIVSTSFLLFSHCRLPCRGTLRYYSLASEKITASSAVPPAALPYSHGLRQTAAVYPAIHLPAAQWMPTDIAAAKDKDYGFSDRAASMYPREHDAS